MYVCNSCTKSDAVVVDMLYLLEHVARWLRAANAYPARMNATALRLSHRKRGRQVLAVERGGVNVALPSVRCQFAAGSRTRAGLTARGGLGCNVARQGPNAASAG